MDDVLATPIDVLGFADDESSVNELRGEKNFGATSTQGDQKQTSQGNDIVID